MKSYTGICVTMLTACLLTACGDLSANSRSTAADAESTAGSRYDATPVQPDNTGVNTRDVSSDNPTAGDQSEAPGDVDKTQRIRQAVVADRSLSIGAQNVKIITMAGKVTLRGPVDTEEEKSKIMAMALQVAGAANVDNQIEVKR